jgi:hypothetical protein
MYVHEYGHQSPKPNKMKSYVSYLDSANYMQPSCFRTPMYQELMLGYLQDAKNRGFGSVYIWACPPPPRAGDSYILSVHPKWQRTPNTERLVKWYKMIEDIGEKEGLIVYSEDMIQSHWFGHQQSRATRHSSSRNGILKSSKAKGKIDSKSYKRKGNNTISSSSSARPKKKKRGRPPLSINVAEVSNNGSKNIQTNTEEYTLVRQSVYDLPYFQGDFWISEIEKILFELDGYGMPGDPDAAMRYWWKEQTKERNTATSSFSSSSSSSVKQEDLPYPEGLTDPKRREAWRALDYVYTPTLAAVLPDNGLRSSLKSFERRGTPQSHGVGVGGEINTTNSTIERYNCVRFQMMNDNVSTVLTRRQNDLKYKIKMEELMARKQREEARLALIPDHLPTFEERESWLMSNLKTRISPMADQFLIWHLNPSCYHCNEVLTGGGGSGGDKCWLYKATTVSAGKKVSKKFLCLKCNKNPDAKGSLLAYFSQSIKKISHNKKESPVIVKSYTLPKGHVVKKKNNGNDGALPKIPRSSIFDSRMGVLAYEQRMGFQFDQLRRAKHSTMMLLLQLHRSLLKKQRIEKEQKK